eukprot:UN12914
MLLMFILCCLAHRQYWREPNCLGANWHISGGRDMKGTSQLAHQCSERGAAAADLPVRTDFLAAKKQL